MRNIDIVYKALLIKPQSAQAVYKTLDGLLDKVVINQALSNLKKRNKVQVIGTETEHSGNSTSKRQLSIYKALPLPEKTKRSRRTGQKRINLTRAYPKAVLKQLIIETNPLFMMYGKTI